jgi:hypothetical protein
MLEDRLSTAGLALREAPLPTADLADLAARRHHRTTRRLAAATVAAALVALVGLAALRTIERHPVRVVDVGPGEVHVPKPTTPDQFLPRMPDGWTLTSWRELQGGIAGNPSVEVFTDWQVDFARHPYLVLLDMQHNASLSPIAPTDQTVLVHGTPAKIATTDGLRHVNFQVGEHVLTALGSQVGDDTLQRFADGVTEDPTASGGVRAGWLPEGLRSTGHHSRAYPGSLGTRSFTWTGPDDAHLTFTTATDGEEISLEQLLWDEPGTDGEIADAMSWGVRRGETTKLTWSFDPHVGLTTEWTGLPEDEVRRIMGDLVRYTPGELADVLDGVPTAPDGTVVHRQQLTPSVVVFDDVVGDSRRTATLYLADGVDDGPPAVCWWVAGGGGCTPLDGMAAEGGPALQLIGSGPEGAWFVARDDVAEVAVHQRGQATRVYEVARPFDDVPGLAFVAQPDGSLVEWVEARAADGTALSRIVGLPGAP